MMGGSESIKTETSRKSKEDEQPTSLPLESFKVVKRVIINVGRVI
jgi:hypothetical protein